MDSKAEEWSYSAAERAERTSESPLARKDDTLFGRVSSPTIAPPPARVAGRRARAQHGC